MLRFIITIVAIGILTLVLPDMRAAAFPELARGSTAADTLLHPSAFRCGTYDGKFSCRRAPDVVVPQGGKNAIPGAQRATEPLQEETPQPSAAPLATPGVAPPASATGCPAGMVGSPPNCQCPRGSEQLGGHCIAYTESCATGLAANANPQACPSADEKQVCTVRTDGLKDCCCRTYSKF